MSVIIGKPSQAVKIDTLGLNFVSLTQSIEDDTQPEIQINWYKNDGSGFFKTKAELDAAIEDTNFKLDVEFEMITQGAGINSDVDIIQFFVAGNTEMTNIQVSNGVLSFPGDTFKVNRIENLNEVSVPSVGTLTHLYTSIRSTGNNGSIIRINSFTGITFP